MQRRDKIKNNDDARQDSDKIKRHKKAHIKNLFREPQR